MTNQPGGPASPGEAFANVASANIERQLTQFLASVAKQVEGVRESAAHTIAALQSEVERRLDALTTRLEVSQSSNESFRQNITAALEELLAEQTAVMRSRVDDLDRRLLAASNSADLTELRDQVQEQLGIAHERIDEVHKTTHRFDEQAAVMVQHLNDTSVALTQRVDESVHALAAAVEERLASVREVLEAVGPSIQGQLNDQTAALTQRLELADDTVTDRLLALEARINDTQGTRIAELEAMVGRIESGFDESLGAISHRLLELDNRLARHDQLVADLDQRVASIDQSGLDQLKEQMSSTIGEATLVRIELDRAMATTAEKLDKANVRMAEIEGLLSDEMDVNASVQLERLEEIERALAELDPTRFDTAPRSAARYTVSAPTPEPDYIPPYMPPPTGAAAANLSLTVPASWGLTPVNPAETEVPEAPATPLGLKSAGPLSARLSAAGHTLTPPELPPTPTWPAVPTGDLDPHLPDPASGDGSDDTPAG